MTGSQLLLGQDRLKFSERIAADRPARQHPCASDNARELERRGVTGADRRTPLVTAGQPDASAVEARRREDGYLAAANDRTVTPQHPRAAEPVASGVRELDLVLAWTDVLIGLQEVPLLAVQVVQRPAAEGRSHRQQGAVGASGLADDKVDDDCVVAIPHVDSDRFGYLGAAGEVAVVISRLPAVGLGVHKGPQHPVVQRQYLVALSLGPPEVYELAQQLRTLARHVSRLRQVLLDVVQLPDIVVKGRVRILIVVERADGVEGHRLPSAVIDGPRAEHLEVLSVVAFW